MSTSWGMSVQLHQRILKDLHEVLLSLLRTYRDGEGAGRNDNFIRQSGSACRLSTSRECDSVFRRLIFAIFNCLGYYDRSRDLPVAFVSSSRWPAVRTRVDIVATRSYISISILACSLFPDSHAHSLPEIGSGNKFIGRVELRSD